MVKVVIFFHGQKKQYNFGNGMVITENKKSCNFYETWNGTGDCSYNHGYMICLKVKKAFSKMLKHTIKSVL